MLAFWLGVIGPLLFLGAIVPADLLSVRPGPRRIGTVGLVLAGTLEFDAWLAVIVRARTRALPAVAAAALVIAASVGAFGVVRYLGGTAGPERVRFDFAVGMLGIPFVFDGILEASAPGILAVSALFAHLLVRLGRSLRLRSELESFATPSSPV